MADICRMDNYDEKQDTGQEEKFSALYQGSVTEDINIKG